MADYDFMVAPEATQTEAKPWWKSKMIWVNGITLIAGVVGYLAGHELIADNATLLAGLVAIQGLLNTILRFTTWQKIG
jgi:hypothetical protein